MNRAELSWPQRLHLRALNAGQDQKWSAVIRMAGIKAD